MCENRKAYSNLATSGNIHYSNLKFITLNFNLSFYLLYCWLFVALKSIQTPKSNSHKLLNHPHILMKIAQDSFAGNDN